jgi:site-specific recombinase XerD
MPSAVTGMQLTNSWSGTAPSRACRSAKRLSSGTECIWRPAISLRALSTFVSAVRRLAYEATDCGLLSADLAAGIRRVKGLKKLGVRLGNWLTAEQGQALWQAPNPEQMKGKRDRALLALLLACGLRRHELASLTLSHLQRAKGIGQSWTCAERVVTFGPFPSRIGCMAYWMTGQGPPELARAAFSGG